MLVGRLFHARATVTRNEVRSGDEAVPSPQKILKSYSRKCYILVHFCWLSNKV